MSDLIEVFRPVDKQFPVSSPFMKNRIIVIDGVTTTQDHNGIDFKCPEETPVYAVMSGQIYKVGYQDEENKKVGYGYRIIQRGTLNGKNYWIYYGHLKWSIVHTNYFVRQGEYMAMSGNTGHSTGAHLHVSIRENDSKDYIDFTFKEV